MIRKLMAHLAAQGLACLCLPGMLQAQEVFRSVDENGVVHFSDVASAGAQRLQLPSASVPEGSMARQQAIIDQQLTVAKSLEESRLAREAARTERIKALADARPPTVYYRETTRYVGGYGNHWGSRPGYPGHPGVRPPFPVHPIEPPPGGGGRLDPPSRPVKFPSLPSGGG